MTLKPLAEHNLERREVYRQMDEAMRQKPNGLACPQCGSELWDSNPAAVLDGMPPQKNVHCPECDYRGFALA